VVVDWYENIRLGDVMVTKGRTLGESDVINFAMLTGDWNPLHCDAEYAAKAQFGTRIAHGMLVLAVMSGLVELRAPYVKALYGFDKVRFLRPTYFGDTIKVVSTVVGRSDKEDGGGVVTFEAQVRNQKDEPVAICTIKILVETASASGAQELAVMAGSGRA
jgi:3-hydroxybutyryl-CoA dehydratase